jgi:hypothetical protein
MYSKFNSLGSIVSHIENAVGEVAYSYPDEFPELVKRARKQGVRDIPGWLADELYNDSDMVCDLAGDALYEFVSAQGEDPRDNAVWNKYVDDLQGYLRHVSLDRLRN